MPKPKEPLVAVMLGVIVTGLGQIYARRILRGILFFLSPLIIVIPSALYIFHPQTAISPLWWSLPILAVGYAVFVVFDGYRCAKAYNAANHIVVRKTRGKRALFVAGIIFFTFVNPSQIIRPSIAYYIRYTFVQAFSIPTKTMEPTLRIGDKLLVDKTAYRKEEPNRGDVVVFIYPKDTTKDFVKRLAGLPGETIEIKDGQLLINGARVSDEAFADKRYYNRGEYGKACQLVTVPDDCYYVLGDNSSASNDSRYFGFVPRKNLIGKAYKIYYPFNRSGPIR